MAKRSTRRKGLKKSKSRGKRRPETGKSRAFVKYTPLPVQQVYSIERRRYVPPQYGQQQYVQPQYVQTQQGPGYGTAIGTGLGAGAGFAIGDAIMGDILD